MSFKNGLFYILPYHMANVLVEENAGLNVISVEREKFVDASLCSNHLHLAIDDLGDSTKNRDRLLEARMVYPEKEHVLQALDFDKKHMVHIIHCYAGISRSTAIGYALLRGRGMPVEKALDLILKLVPAAWPNRRIIRFTNEIFGDNLTNEQLELKLNLRAFADLCE